MSPTKNAYRNAAGMTLDYLRRNISNPDMIFFRQVLEKGGISLADIGTSEEEIAKLQLDNSKSRARKHLEVLRRKPRYENHNDFLIFLRGEISKGGFSLAAIGTSEEELVSLE